MKQKIFALKFLSAIILIICFILTSACSFEKTGESTLREVKDANGTMVSVKEKPQRIVSLGVSVDDILTDLVPPERITALTYLADDPGISNVAEKAKQIKKRAQANVESVVALNPDLVIIPSWQPQILVQSLRDVGIVVYVCTTAENIGQIKKSIREVADAVGEIKQGENLIAQMDADLNEVSAKVAGIPENERLVALRFSPMGAGTGSTFDEICHLAGVKNAAAIAGLQKNQIMSKEQIIMLNPDFFLLPTWDYSRKMDLNKFKEELQNDPALQTVKAVQNKRLYNVPDRYLYSTSHYMVTAIKEVAKVAYPHLFSEIEKTKEAD